MNLAKSAMLVSVTVINGGLLGERKDAKASALVANTYQVADKRTKASKYLIDRNHKAVKRVIAASQRIREVVYRYTMPWGDEKMRLLPVKTAEEFKTRLKAATRDWEDTRESYILNYPALVSASERDLAELFDRSQYPSPDQVRGLFKIKTTYWPIPEQGHFIADISDEAAKQAKESIEAEIELRLEEATYDMVKRARIVVSELIDKLEGLELKNSKLSGTVRDSLADNLSTTANLIERMNLTNSKKIAKVVTDLKRLESVTHPGMWRNNPETFASDRYGKKKALSVAGEIMANLVRLDLKDKEVDDMIDQASDYLDF